jgi:hypothetical protein
VRVLEQLYLIQRYRGAGDWFPDLRTREVVVGGGVMVKF